MKTIALLFFSAFLLLPKTGTKCPSPEAMHVLTGNQVNATILNGGDLFWNGGDGQFLVPVEGMDPSELRSTIFASALWMGGLDPGGNLKVAAQTYGRYSNTFDYVSGPLVPETGEPYEGDYCDFFDRIWVAEKAEILNHIADFADNGQIDNPIDHIFAWPGNKNYWSFQYNGMPLPDNPNGWAPFHDINGDGIYQPDLGEFPHPPHVISILHPEQITWAVFNDNKLHLQSGAAPIQAEIQQTAWNFNCFANHVLNHSVFTSHKIINRATEPIDSFFVGLWVDFDNGCHLDDYMGSSPENDGFLVYNSDNLDGESSPTDCAGINTYGENPPAQSVTFLNKDLDKFIYYNNNSSTGPGGPIGTDDPSIAQDYYKYLTGSWRDGTSLTLGGDGYDPGGIATDHAFPHNPNDSQGWSMYSEGLANGDRRAIGSTKIGTLNPGEATRLDMAFTYHGYPSLDFLGSANQAYIEMAEMQQMYDAQFNGWCEGLVSNVIEILEADVELYPNPSNGHFYIQSQNIKFDKIQVYNTAGKLLFETQDLNSDGIDLSTYASGLYYIKLFAGHRTITKKVITVP